MALRPDVSRTVVVGGGIAGLAAALRLERLLPGTEVVLVESAPHLGGKIVTERIGEFVVDGGPDSFLTSKPRGVGLCDELGLSSRLIPRESRDSRTFVRLRGQLHTLPAGLTGMIPTRLDSMAESGILSEGGLARLARELELPPAPRNGDESLAAFIRRRMGVEAYERLVGPLMCGIFGGNGDRLSLAATFPALRGLELEHGSVMRGLLARSVPNGDAPPPFVSLRGGMAELVECLILRLNATRVVTGCTVTSMRRANRGRGYDLCLGAGEALTADAVVLATPAYVAAGLLEPLDTTLAEAHAGIPHASSAIVTLAYPSSDVQRALDGYGYVVPEIEGSDVLACTWSSSKWPGRAPAGHALVRTYMGRSEGRDVTTDSDAELVTCARREVSDTLGVDAGPLFARVHRWQRGMPQYVLGHLDRLATIESRLTEHPRLAVAGAAYRGVGIPDCIASGEAAAERVAASS
ncbi:MAG: protoporphyrinogen/coproporphyrinogen oxidase [Gaiellales bacterium]|nr:protoporphyrinogen/coproporphyrinogen oxidase [Gaiellales bacterium]